MQSLMAPTSNVGQSIIYGVVRSTKTKRRSWRREKDWGSKIAHLRSDSNTRADHCPPACKQLARAQHAFELEVKIFWNCSLSGFQNQYSHSMAKQRNIIHPDNQMHNVLPPSLRAFSPISNSHQSQKTCHLNSHDTANYLYIAFTSDEWKMQ